MESKDSEPNTMSNIAPLVAAALRDKTVADLMNENEILKSQLKTSQKIEIGMKHRDENTDNFSRVLIAEGNLEDGQYQKGGKIFLVPLRNNAPCPTRRLEEVALCFGGFLRTKIYGVSEVGIDDEFWGDFRYGLADTATSKVLAIGGSLATEDMDEPFFVTIVVHNWPRRHYEAIMEQWEDDTLDCTLLDYLAHRLPEFFPDSYVTFEKVALNESANRTALNNLPSRLSADQWAEMDEERMARMEEAQTLRNLTLAVSRTYFDMYGDHELWATRSAENPRLNANWYDPHDDLPNLLKGMYHIHEITDDNRDVLEAILRIHWECQSYEDPDEEFWNRLPQTVDGLVGNNDAGDADGGNEG